MRELRLKKEYNSLKELRADVAEYMKYDTVVTTRQQVFRYFNLLHGRSILTGEVKCELVINQYTDVINKRKRERSGYYILIFAYYIDSGSDDYVYTVKMGKDYTEAL